MENSKDLLLTIDEFETKLILDIISFDPDITNRIGDIHSELFCKKLILNKRDVSLKKII